MFQQGIGTLYLQNSQGVPFFSLSLVYIDATFRGKRGLKGFNIVLHFMLLGNWSKHSTVTVVPFLDYLHFEHFELSFSRKTDQSEYNKNTFDDGDMLRGSTATFVLSSTV